MNLPIPSTFQTRVVAGLTVSLLVSCNWLINNILNDYYYYYFDLNYSHCKLSLWILMEIILQYTKTRGYLWRGRVDLQGFALFSMRSISSHSNRNAETVTIFSTVRKIFFRIVHASASNRPRHATWFVHHRDFPSPDGCSFRCVATTSRTPSHRKRPKWFNRMIHSRRCSPIRRCLSIG